MGKNADNFLGGTSRIKIIMTNFSSLKNYLTLSFSILVPLLFYWRHFKELKDLYFTVIIFITTIVFYRGAEGNIRYYIAISLILGAFIALNWQRLPISLKRISLFLFILINLFTISYYNSVSFHSWTKPLLYLGSLDNLRLTRGQLERKKSIDLINSLYSEGYTNLIYIQNYYGDSTWHIWEKDGYFPEGMKIFYFKSWDPNVLKRKTFKKTIIYDAKKRIKLSECDTKIIRKIKERVFVVDIKNGQ